MVLTQKQLRIFEAFLRQPYKELTYKEIKANEKSNSATQAAIAKFIAEGLVQKRAIGNVLLYAADLKNSAALSYFNILAQDKLSPAAKSSLSIIKGELSGTEFSSIVVFGSYAEGRERKNSDLDVAIFVKTEEEKNMCERAMKTAQLKSLLKLDVHFITKEEMLAMLKDKHENLGKQIAHKHLAIQNPEIFYSLVQAGIDNGFKVIYPSGRERDKAIRDHLHDK